MATNKGVLVDITRCIGCESCVVACRLYNGLESDPKEGSQSAPTGGNELTANRWTVVQDLHINKSGKEVRRFVKQQCFHCLEPACASACFSKALRKTENGPVVYDEKLCVGCRYCMVACPFHTMKFEWNKPFPRVLKCQMCLGRVDEGLMPACASVCPTRAVIFGDRDTLIEQAQRRLSRNPGLYYDEIYGLKEAGGTSWLYISDVPFEQLGFPTTVPDRPLPEYTFQVLKWTPAIFVGWGAILTGLYLYSKRRTQIESEEEMYAPLNENEGK